MLAFMKTRARNLAFLAAFSSSSAILNAQVVINEFVYDDDTSCGRLVVGDIPSA